MQNIKVLLLPIALACCFTAFAKEDTTYVNNLLENGKKLSAEDPKKAIEIAQQAREIAANINYAYGEATALKNIGLVHYHQQNWVEVLDYWNRSLKIFQEIKDDVGISNLLNNIGGVYFAKGDDTKALEYSLEALKLAEKTEDKLRIMSSLSLISAIYHNKKDPRAIEYSLKALPICEELDNLPMLTILLGNIGEIYLDQKEYDKALPFFQRSIKVDNNSAQAAFAYNGIGKIYLQNKNFANALRSHHMALNISTRLDDKLHQIRALKGIANVHVQKREYKTALDSYLSAKNLAEGVEANVELKEIYPEMAEVYAKISDYSNAYKYQELYSQVKDVLYDIESAKKLGVLQFEFDLYKKEGEVALLTKDNELKAAEVIHQRQEKTAFAIGLGLILIIAMGIYRNYRNKVKINRILDQQKVQIENLLLNILPQEVATELKEHGTAKPRHYEKVSVLFTDFKGFTSIADKMSPQDLVEELNECFMAFDEIVENHNLEKIKTIGDAYMVAGGIPTPDDDHHLRIVKAAMDIRDYINGYNEKRKEQGLVEWGIRIGIHVGPVVAGVVGKKKYAYDIWGSTVNVASRMESSGAAGQINISSTTYELIKDRYICSHRGKIHAKNVGDVDMYFVEQELGVRIPMPEFTVPVDGW